MLLSSTRKAEVVAAELAAALVEAAGGQVRAKYGWTDVARFAARHRLLIVIAYREGHPRGQSGPGPIKRGMGIGIYPHGHFIHVDVRAFRARQKLKEQLADLYGATDD